METYHIQVRWSPGHEGIIGNEEADSLADAEARNPSPPYGMARHPTTSGIRSVARTLLNQARQGWWDVRKTKLSTWYNQWELPYSTSTSPPELELSRPTLAKLIAIRTKHRDFAWYHKKFNHPDAQLKCSCSRLKTPEHIALCRKTKVKAIFRRWPQRPTLPPSHGREGVQYLAGVIVEPRDFETLLQVTGFYKDICTR
ncbi:hypothetical protein J1614_012264 [Plenodomus biglobosus]|nr:hypothetical protein J1614_012264 [Plenodomus biglobosus]